MTLNGGKGSCRDQMPTYSSGISEREPEQHSAPARPAAGVSATPAARSVDIVDLLYPAAILAAVGTWFFAIGTPLWLDETISYWQISGGFWNIWSRQGLSFPAHSYILWLTKTIFGSSEFALRMPSILAMMAAAYVLYKVARELFARETAMIATVVFCVYPTIIFAAIDARPYAFGVLAANCAILALLRWIDRRSTRWAMLFGLGCGLVFYFHFLFGVIVAAFGLILAIAVRNGWKIFLPQLAKAAGVFAVVMLPVVSQLVYLFRTSQSHVFSPAPNPNYLSSIFAPGPMLELFALLAVTAAATRKFTIAGHGPRWGGLACLVLAAVPIAILYGVSTLTPVHVFVERYRLVAVPGIALCWGMLLSTIDSRWLRLLFCVTVVAFAARAQYEEPTHGYTWKYALQTADSHTANDHAPLLICSDLPEADYQTMPTDPLSSGLFGQLSYYRVSSPVVPLPRALNDQARSQVNKFLAASGGRRRFLVVAFSPSQPTVRWIGEVTRDSYTANSLGVFDGVSVTEFDPR